MDRLGTKDKEELRNLNRLEKLAGFQITILKHALNHFPDAKRVVYSTCSIYTQENEEIVAEVLKSCRKFKLVSAQNYLDGPWCSFGSPKYGQIGKFCLYSRPEKDLSNGFFVAVFEKLEEGEENKYFVDRLVGRQNNRKRQCSGSDDVMEVVDLDNSQDENSNSTTNDNKNSKQTKRQRKEKGKKSKKLIEYEEQNSENAQENDSILLVEDDVHEIIRKKTKKSKSVNMNLPVSGSSEMVENINYVYDLTESLNTVLNEHQGKHTTKKQKVKVNNQELDSTENMFDGSVKTNGNSKLLKNQHLDDENDLIVLLDEDELDQETTKKKNKSRGGTTQNMKQILPVAHGDDDSVLIVEDVPDKSEYTKKKKVKRHNHERKTTEENGCIFENVSQDINHKTKKSKENHSALIEDGIDNRAKKKKKKTFQIESVEQNTEDSVVSLEDDVGKSKHSKKMKSKHYSGEQNIAENMIESEKNDSLLLLAEDELEHKTTNREKKSRCDVTQNMKKIVFMIHSDDDSVVASEDISGKSEYKKKKKVKRHIHEPKAAEENDCILINLSQDKNQNSAKAQEDHSALVNNIFENGIIKKKKKKHSKIVHMEQNIEDSVVSLDDDVSESKKNKKNKSKGHNQELNVAEENNVPPGSTIDKQNTSKKHKKQKIHEIKVLDSEVLMVNDVHDSKRPKKRKSDRYVDHIIEVSDEVVERSVNRSSIDDDTNMDNSIELVENDIFQNKNEGKRKKSKQRKSDHNSMQQETEARTESETVEDTSSSKKKKKPK